MVIASMLKAFTAAHIVLIVELLLHEYLLNTVRAQPVSWTMIHFSFLASFQSFNAASSCTVWKCVHQSSKLQPHFPALRTNHADTPVGFYSLLCHFSGLSFSTFESHWLQAYKMLRTPQNTESQLKPLNFSGTVNPRYHRLLSGSADYANILNGCTNVARDNTVITTKCACVHQLTLIIAYWFLRSLYYPSLRSLKYFEYSSPLDPLITHAIHSKWR